MNKPEDKAPESEGTFEEIASWVPLWFTVLVMASLLVVASPVATVKFWSLAAALVSAPLFMSGFLGKLAKQGISPKE